MDFFINEDLVEIKIFDKVFKYKPVTANDELNWSDDYLELRNIKNEKDELEARYIPSVKKLSICKLRNIMEVPFTKEELQKLTNIDKEFKDYTNSEKDILFGKLNPKIYNNLIVEIDKINNNPKKD